MFSLLQNGECHEETIKFGLECMYVDSWARRRSYNAFKETLGSGVRHHLQVKAGALGICTRVCIFVAKMRGVEDEEAFGDHKSGLHSVCCRL